MGLLPVRWLTRLLFPAALLLLIAMWYYTNQLNAGAFDVDNAPQPNNVRIVDVGEGRIRIAPLDGEESAWNRDGLFGLELPTGYARIGRIIDTHPDSVLRELTIVAGEPPVAGSEARVDTFVYRGDPRTALGIEFEEVSITTPAGVGPAWFIPGSSDTWAIFVHGKGASREEAFRILPTLQDAGLPSLLISYRNDADFKQEGTSKYRYGETEWEDLAAAMDYAESRGARQFVLFGNSMGGSVVMATLQRSEYASKVAGVVLDSPMLDLKGTVEYRAGERGIPAPFTKVTLQFSIWRNGIDWTKTDYLASTQALTAPMLVFHGDHDKTVPLSTSEKLAQLRPDIVTLRKVAGAGHVQSWNRDRELYSLQLREFLRKVSSN